MKKITLIDYYGNCDASGRSIGHSPKVLTEYCSLIKDEYQVEAILPKCIVEEIDKTLFHAVKLLPYQIVEEGQRGIGKRIIDKIKLFINISQSLKKAEGDVVWFYRTDFFLFFYFCLHKKSQKHKLCCLVYQQKFAEGNLGKLLDAIYRRGLQKFDGVIYTQKSAVPKHNYTFYMPDYYYDPDKYSKYQGIEKKFKAVCLGTMSPYKKLDELVEAFNQNGIPLEIVGKFFTRDRANSLIQKAGRNIYIEDTILTEEEYYSKLAEAQFVILPYDMKQYAGRTSGILVEAMFVHTVPVAPWELLEENGLVGIGYGDLKELENEDVFGNGYGKALKFLTEQCKGFPKKEETGKNIMQFIRGL